MMPHERSRWKLLCLLGACLMIQAAFALAKADIRVSPENALADEGVTIVVTGLAPGTSITIRASTVDGAGGRWSSEATFKADERGEINVSKQAPVSGSYQGVNGNALVWSMRPEKAHPPQVNAMGLRPPESVPFNRPASGALKIHLEVLQAGNVLAETSFVRTYLTPEVKTTDVHENGLVGRFYEPAAQGRQAALLVLPGSNGGVPVQYAQVLASRGYAVLALAYFRADGLPKDLVEIPLEYFERALVWLRARPSVDAKRIGVVGLSRGAELALLLASTYPEQFQTVVALSPSSVVWEGAVRDPEKSGVAAIQAERSGWSRNGRPLEYVPKTVTPEIRAKLEKHEPYDAIELMMPGLNNGEAMAKARIPVEQIKAPVLLISSQADRMWPSATFAEQVMAELKQHKFGYPYAHLSYAECSHFMPDSWAPPLYGGGIGGTADGTMRAYADYWPRLLKFLDKNLRR